MSHTLNTVTETSEVLTGHTKLICSTDIERLVTSREDRNCLLGYGHFR
jgi:hypothetical protein